MSWQVIDCKQNYLKTGQCTTTDVWVILSLCTIGQKGKVYLHSGIQLQQYVVGVVIVPRQTMLRVVCVFPRPPACSLFVYPKLSFVGVSSPAVFVFSFHHGWDCNVE